VGKRVAMRLPAFREREANRSIGDQLHSALRSDEDIDGKRSRLVMQSKLETIH
jgi:hypothetical protein